MISLGRALGRELAPENIFVTVVAPGIIDTPQLQVDADDAGVSLQEMHAIYAKGIPVGRIGTPDDIAADGRLPLDGRSRRLCRADDPSERR